MTEIYPEPTEDDVPDGSQVPDSDDLPDEVGGDGDDGDGEV